MKTQISKDNALIIFLNKDEVQSLKFNFDNLSVSDKQTRFVLNSLYNEAASKSSFIPPKSERRLIEILPFENGSCIIIFSFPQKRRMKVTARLKTASRLFEFDSKISLYRFFESVRGVEKNQFSALFESSGEYRLLINSDNETLLRILSEYSHAVKDKFAECRTKEYWNCLYCRDKTKTNERTQQPL